MSASLSMAGLKELVRGLDRMPDALAEQSAARVRHAAVEAAAELRTALPLGPARTIKGKAYPGGNLRKGVRVRQLDPLIWQVTSAAPHAFLNEFGTGERVTKRKGRRGVSPASNVVVTVARDRRETMNLELGQVLIRVLSELR
jgi:hypothetical protein